MLDNPGYAGQIYMGQQKGVRLLANIEKMKRQIAQFEGKDIIREREIAQLKREDAIKGNCIKGL
jgi:hypothetical protein